MHGALRCRPEPLKLTRALPGRPTLVVRTKQTLETLASWPPVYPTYVPRPLLSIAPSVSKIRVSATLIWRPSLLVDYSAQLTRSRRPMKVYLYIDGCLRRPSKRDHSVQSCQIDQSCDTPPCAMHSFGLDTISSRQGISSVNSSELMSIKVNSNQRWKSEINNRSRSPSIIEAGSSAFTGQSPI